MKKTVVFRSPCLEASMQKLIMENLVVIIIEQEIENEIKKSLH